MKIYDETLNEITEQQIDLSVGYLVPYLSIRADASPIDGVKKVAWADEDYEESQMYIVLPESARTAQRIDELKRQLSATDYAVIKIAEGAATPDEYAEVIAQRQAWRAEINQLEVAE